MRIISKSAYLRTKVEIPSAVIPCAVIPRGNKHDFEMGFGVKDFRLKSYYGGF